MPASLQVDRWDRVTVFTVERPEVRNALDPATLEALSNGLAAASADPGTGAAVLTGAGSVCFSAEMAELGTSEQLTAETAAGISRFAGRSHPS